MTIHGAKGLEYLYVFVVGAEETVFPSYQSMENGEDAIEEERRLFYVAMTRAMKKLYILFAQGRMLWGNLKFNGPSRFIDEIPEDYYEWSSYKKGDVPRVGKNKSGRQADEFSQLPEYNNSEPVEIVSRAKEFNNSQYPTGSRIKHKLYGIGSVLESEGSGPDEKIVIMFNDGTRKKFMVKFAPIERV